MTDKDKMALAIKVERNTLPTQRHSVGMQEL